MLIDFFDLRASQKVIIVLHPHDPLYTCGISGFGFGLCVLSNMTSAFDADFECPAHITGTLDFEYPLVSFERFLIYAIEEAFC